MSEFEGFPPIPDFLKRDINEPRPVIPYDAPRLSQLNRKPNNLSPEKPKQVVIDRNASDEDKVKAMLVVEATTLRTLYKKLPAISRERLTEVVRAMVDAGVLKQDGHWYSVK